MEIKERIEKAQNALKAAEQAKTVAETQLTAAQKECDDVIAEMGTLGVTPENIDAEIQRLEKEVDHDLTAVEQAIPTV